MNKKEVNKSIIKRILWIFLAVLLLVVFILAINYTIFAYVIRLGEYRSAWSFSAKYEQYADEFNLVKDYIADKYPDEDDKWVSLSYNAEKGTRIFDPDIMDYLTLPDDVASALDTIYKNGFPRQNFGLDVIRIHKEIISFRGEQGRYALVFSPDKKPTWIHPPHKRSRVEVKKIEDGWYHVVNRG